MSKGLGFMGLVLLGLAGCGGGADDPAAEPSALLGAHYYTWYDSEHHWDMGAFQRPSLGYYDSADPRVAEQHIEWARSAGISVFAVEWTSEPWNIRNFEQGLLRAGNLDQIKFCLFYDTDIRLRLIGFNDPYHFDFGDIRLRRAVVEDIVGMASRYFSHPSYFRIHGRPVLWLYLTRSFEGPWAEALDEARRRVSELGYDLYILADEVWYWEPDPARISNFDAVSTYSLYEPYSMRERASWTISEFLDVFWPAFQHWSVFAPKHSGRASGRPVPFLPQISLHYDDSAVRGTLNPPVLPESREVARRNLTRARELALANADPEERIVWLTTFNEWHEGTAIEPSVAGAAPYQGGAFGSEFLDAVREVFATP